jgi:hypothetical protein
MKNALLIVTLFFFNIWVAAAQGSKATGEFDPGISVALDISPKARIDLATGREKSEELATTKWKISAGVSFRVKPLRRSFLDRYDADKNHVLVLASGYEYSYTAESGTSKIEHKLMFDATPRYAFEKKLLMSDRNRLELRWINGDFHYRYRNRLQIERPLKLKGKQFSPFGAAEGYWDQRYNKWSIFKFTGGVQVPFIRRSTIDFYYERQHCVTCSDPNTNIYGITLNLSFKLRKR